MFRVCFEAYVCGAALIKDLFSRDWPGESPAFSCFLWRRARDCPPYRPRRKRCANVFAKGGLDGLRWRRLPSGRVNEWREKHRIGSDRCPIAAYQAADLTSQLTKQGCEVRVVLTANALRFITPLAFKTLSRHPVVTDLFDEEEGWKPTHIRLADEADLLLIAPATANILAKLANGLADDALSCIALALNPKAAKLLVALSDEQVRCGCTRRRSRMWRC